MNSAEISDPPQVCTPVRKTIQQWLKIQANSYYCKIIKMQINFKAK